MRKSFAHMGKAVDNSLINYSSRFDVSIRVDFRLQLEVPLDMYILNVIEGEV